MGTDAEADERGKKERSPAYPFISLRKATERVRAMYVAHRRDFTRLSALAPTWGYGAKSSGLQQTVGALKQFGLIDETGSGDERRVQVSDFARRILSDERPGAREAALREAALKPKVFAEYQKWIGDRPSDLHCLSELTLDRGFNELAARAFLRSFDETMQFAGLAKGDSDSAPLADEPAEMNVDTERADPAEGYTTKYFAPKSAEERPSGSPFEVVVTADGRLKGSFSLMTKVELERLIRTLKVNGMLMDDEPITHDDRLNDKP